MEPINRLCSVRDLQLGYQTLESILERLESEIPQLKLRAQQYQQTNTELIAERVHIENDLKIKCNQLEKLTDDNKNLKDHIESYRTIITSQNTSLGNKNAKMKTLRLTNESLQKQIKTVVSQLANDLQDAKKKFDEKLAATKTLRQTEKLTAALACELKNNELINAKAEIAKLNKKIDELTDHLSATKATFAQMHKAASNKTAVTKELASVKSEMNKYKTNADNANKIIETMNKELALTKKCIDEMVKDLQKKSHFIADRDAVIDTLKSDLSNVNKDTTSIPCSICSSSLSQNDVIVSTKCGHVYHNDCLLPWIQRSKTCPKCRKTATNQQLTKIYLDMVNVNGRSNSSNAINRIETFNFTRERNSLNAIISEVQGNCSKYNEELRLTLAEYKLRTSTDPYLVSYIDIYRLRIINFCRTWSILPVTQHKLPYMTYRDHDLLAQHLTLVTQKINGIWSQYCTTAWRKLLVQSIGLALIMRFKKDASQIPIAMVKFMAVCEICSITRLYFIKLKNFVKPDYDTAPSELLQPQRN